MYQSPLVILATDEEYRNDNQLGRLVNPKKLPAVYRELREKVFTGKPIHENQGDNNLVFRSRRGPYGNYGWQLFKTPKGTAMLEYQGSVSYWSHQGQPVPIEKEDGYGLRQIWVTFHQDEGAVEEVRKIVEMHTKKRGN